MELRILGTLEVVDDGPVLLKAPKQRRLLAALIVNRPNPVPVDLLVEAVWGGDRPPASAAQLVQVYVSQLRKALPSALRIETRPSGYALSVASADVDADRFGQLVSDGRSALRDGVPALASALLGRALSLWRGPALADFAYDDFARAETARLEELRLAAVADRIDAELMLGHHAEALPELRSLVDAHPLQERFHRQTMLALYRCGRQAEALQAYHDAERVLREELGLDPGTELRALHLAILRHDESLAAPRHETDRHRLLPAQVTPLVGRERELAELRSLVERPEVRLLTLTGVGGTGKTRVAIALGELCADSFANGVAFVDLSPLRDPELVPAAIARALDITARGPASRTLESWLGPRELLIIVDNFEHVLDGARFLAKLLEASPRLVLLATSRRVLHLRGEHVYPLEPLAEDDGLCVFVQRARALEPAFDLSPSDERVAREICRRVDCLPLAIELAAAQTRAFPLGRLLELLAARLTLLVGGQRDLPARQQTLRDTLTWSTDLLPPENRRELAWLSVFAGGISGAAADAVCGSGSERRTALAEHNLLNRVDRGGDVRFSMLETIREHASALLVEMGDVDDAVRAHGTYFSALVEQADLRGADQSAWFVRLDAELENLRVAMDRALGAGDPATALRIASGLFFYWYLRGDLREGRRRIEESLAGSAGDQRLQARSMRALAGLSWVLGDADHAEACAQEGVAVGEAVGERESVIGCLTVLGFIAQERGNLDDARAYIERSAQLASEGGLEEEAAVANKNLASIALDSGDPEDARRRWEATLASFRADHRGDDDGFSLLGLGLVAYRQNRLDEASARFSEALHASRPGFPQLAGHALIGLAAVAAARAEPHEAALLLGRAAKNLDEVGASARGFDVELHERTVASVRTALGADSYVAAFAKAGVSRRASRQGIASRKRRARLILRRR